METITLYTYFRSSASYRVRIALYLKGLSFQDQSIHLVQNGGEQNSQEYRGINPLREVPSLKIGNKTLSQSLPIIEYLDELVPTQPLFPKDPYEKARVRQVCEHINCGIHPIQNLKVLQYIERNFSQDAAGKKKWANHWITLGFQGLEKVLETSAGTYCFGGQITAADLFLVPQVFNAHRFEVDLNAFPIISQIEKNCLQLDAFQKASPMNQPDAP